MLNILTKSGPSSETQNTFNLPTGADIRDELVSIFRDQHAAILAFVDESKAWGVLEFKWGLPLAWPTWDSLGLGVSNIVDRVKDSIVNIWEKAGAGFLALLGLDPDGWDANDPRNIALIEKGLQDLATEINGTTSDQLKKALDTVAREVHDGKITTDQAEAELTKDVDQIFGNAEDWRARMIAVTEASRAYHAAIAEAAREFGDVVGWKWLTNGDPCPICIEIEAECQFVPEGRPFAIIGDNSTYQTIDMPPAHPNCCLPETPIVAPCGVAGIVAQYDGPVVRLVFSDGTDVTVTPNHMLLTVEGFAKASSLMEGDEVIRYCGHERISRSGPDDDWKPALIKDVVSSFAEPSRVAAGSVPVAPEYLHGDAAFCDGHINVVTSNRLLWDHIEPPQAQAFADGSLNWASMPAKAFDRRGDLASVLIRLRGATDGGMSSTRELNALGWGQLSHPFKLAFGRRPNGNAGLKEPPSYSGAADAEIEGDSQFRFSPQIALRERPRIHAHPFVSSVGLKFDSRDFDSMLETAVAQAHALRDVLKRFPSLVTTNNVVHVNVFHYVGPVYDVQTLTSLYTLGNGIASSNCMCTAEPVMAGDEPPDWGDTLIQPTGKKGYVHERVLSIKAFPVSKRFPRPGFSRRVLSDS